MATDQPRSSHDGPTTPKQTQERANPVRPSADSPYPRATDASVRVNQGTLAKVDRLRQGVSDKAQNVAGKIHNTADQAKSSVHAAIDLTKSGMRDASEHTKTAARDTAKDTAKKLDTTARIAVAGGAIWVASISGHTATHVHSEKPTPKGHDAALVTPACDAPHGGDRKTDLPGKVAPTAKEAPTKGPESPSEGEAPDFKKEARELATALFEKRNRDERNSNAG